MKRVCYLLLAVLMILPMIVACGNSREGTPVEVANVKVISYKDAYTEAATGAPAQLDKTLAAEVYAGPITAYVAEGASLLLKDVVDGYALDIDGSAVYDESTDRYTKMADLAAADGFFWNYYVNGNECGLNTPIQPTDAIEIVFEK